MKAAMIALTLCIGVVFSGCVSVKGSVVHQTWEQPYGKLRHVVMYAYNDTATPEQRTEVEARFRRLPAAIPQIKAFECGVDMSGRSMSKGLTHCNLFTFDNQEDLRVYIDHQAHKDFVAFARPYLKDLFVFDYIAAE